MILTLFKTLLWFNIFKQIDFFFSLWFHCKEKRNIKILKLVVHLNNQNFKITQHIHHSDYQNNGNTIIQRNFKITQHIHLCTLLHFMDKK